MVCFRRFSNAVNDSARFYPGNRVNHQPVLFSYAEWTDNLFGGIVVDRHFTVIQEISEIWLLFQAVVKTVACLGS